MSNPPTTNLAEQAELQILAEEALRAALRVAGKIDFHPWDGDTGHLDIGAIRICILDARSARLLEALLVEATEPPEEWTVSKTAEALADAMDRIDAVSWKPWDPDAVFPAESGCLKAGVATLHALDEGAARILEAVHALSLTLTNAALGV